ncbi:thymidylate synthase [Opitutus sp. GAS368]|uniref:thymidylate synthase n=1 Tax=Opitutus sp. GAS368 TaxID=1882749 RepID=UPI0012FE13DC|nr:thymidylate synthase [Opitutus sp. GAS368]
MIHSFEGNTADEAWREAALALLQGPDTTVQESRVGKTRELLHVALQIKDPRQRWIVSRRDALNVAFALAEVIWILEGRNDARFLVYFNRKLTHYAGDAPVYHGAYGERLRKRFGLDQLRRATSALRGNPQSRQVVLQIWSSEDDLPHIDGQPVSADIPCNLVSMLKVRGGRLDWTQVMRSNDAYRGTPHNIVQFTCLQEVIAGWLGVGLGTYTHWSDSLHFYEDSLQSSPVAPVQATVHMNTDTLSLPEAEFDRIWPSVMRLAEAITDETHSSKQLMEMLAQTALPLGWANIVRILLAEGLRRRRAINDIPAVVESVSNPALKDLWARWFVRVGSP